MGGVWKLRERKRKRTCAFFWIQQNLITKKSDKTEQNSEKDEKQYFVVSWKGDENDIWRKLEMRLSRCTWRHKGAVIRRENEKGRKREDWQIRTIETMMCFWKCPTTAARQRLIVSFLCVYYQCSIFIILCASLSKKKLNNLPLLFKKVQHGGLLPSTTICPYAFNSCLNFDEGDDWFYALVPHSCTFFFSISPRNTLSWP